MTDRPLALDTVDFVELDPNRTGSVPQVEPTWAEAMWAQIQTQPIYDFGYQLTQRPIAQDPDDSFSFENEDLAGYEEYYRDFIGARSSQEVDFIKSNIDRHLRLRQQTSQLGFGSILLSELANPINYIPLPGLRVGRGAQVTAGALRGSASFGAIIAAEEGLRQAIDPTATAEESLYAIGFGAALGGILGGAVNAFPAVNGRSFSGEAIGAEYVAEMSLRAEAGLPPPAPQFSGLGRFEAVPTTEGTAGIAPVFGGLQKWAETQTVFGRGQATGIRAVGEFMERMLGDYGLKLQKNKLGLPTAESIDLLAGAWRGKAGDAVRELEQIWTRYKVDGGEGGMRVADMSPAVMASRARELTGVKSDKMEMDQFLEAVFRAHKRDRIETDNPFVKEAVDVVRRFYDDANVQGQETGFFRTRKNWSKEVDKRMGRARQLIRRKDELLAKQADGSITPNELLSLERLIVAENGMIARLQRMALGMVDESPELADIVRRWDEQDAAWRKQLAETMEDLKASGREQRLAQEAFERQIQKDRELLDYFNRLEESAGLTDKQRAYRDALQEIFDELDEGSDPLTKSQDTSRRQFLQGLAASAAAAIAAPALPAKAATPVTETLKAAIGQGNLSQVISLLKQSSNPEYALLAERLDRSGLGDTTIEFMFNTRATLGGTTTLRPDGSSQIKINFDSGLNEETLLHELLHAFIQQRWGGVSLYLPQNKRLLKDAVDRNDQVLADYRQLWRDINTALEKNQPEAIASAEWGNALNDPDELLAWSLTNRDLQAFLRSVDAQGNKVDPEGSLWEQFKSWFLQLIGVEYTPKVSSALDEVLLAGNNVVAAGKDVPTGDFNKKLADEFYKSNKMDLHNHADRKNQKAENRSPADAMSNRDFMTLKQQAYYDKLQKILRGDEVFVDADFSPPNEKFYLNRMWVPEKIIGREEELEEIFFNWFKENPKPGTRPDDDAIRARAKAAVEEVMGVAQREDLQLFRENNGAGARFANARGIDIPNELVADFIETNVAHLMRVYGTRFGLMNEMTKAFGDRSAHEAIEDVMMQAALEVDASDLSKARQTLADIEKDLYLARDKATGAVYTDEAADARRHAQYLKAYGILTSMGTAVISSLTEVGRAGMVHGFRRTFGATLEAMTNASEFKQLRAYMRTHTGEDGSAVLTGDASRFINEGGPTGAGSSQVGRWLRKMSDFAYGPYFKLNLLTPFTDLMKGHSNYVTTKFLYEDVMSWKPGNTKLQERLASMGLSEADIKAVQAEKAISTEGGLSLNLDNWKDEGAARRFVAAVGGVTRRIIVTPSLADLPEYVKGFINGREAPYITLPFQFMSWGFSAVNKIMLSGLQGRDKSAAAGVVALVGLGYMVEALKVPEYVWDKMSFTERMVRAVDRSGVTAVFSDVPTMAETLTGGTVSARALVGLDPYLGNSDYFSAAGEVGGPAIGKAADIAALMVRDDAQVDDYTAAIRRAIPLNNLLYWKGLVRDLEKDTASGIEYLME